MCYTPQAIKEKRTGEYISVPCGSCPKCISRRISGWSFRLMQEDKYSDSSYFITFTYDTMHVPISDNGFLSLNFRHLQLLFKRLRKVHDRKYNIVSSNRQRNDNGEKQSRKSLKYYACGEYGTKGARPHYHGIVFNLDLELMLSKNDLLLLKHTDYDGMTEVRIKQWEHGHVTIGKVSGASVGYTLKYMCKDKWKRKHARDDREKERSLMSKHLGADYMTDAMMKWHHDDLLNRMYINLEGNKKAAMPRYYKNKIYTQSERSEVGGYQKGKIEVDTAKAISTYFGNTSYHHSKGQAIKASFRNMYHNESKRQKI